MNFSTSNFSGLINITQRTIIPEMLRQKAVLAFPVLILGIVCIAVLQDFMHSLRNNYSFYLSESLLFKVFWVLFIPVAYFLLPHFKRHAIQVQIPSVVSQILVFAASATLAHALLFSMLVYGISALLFDHTYSILGNLTYTFSSDGIFYFIVYGGIGVAALFQASAKAQAQVQLKNDAPMYRQAQPEMQSLIIGTPKHQVVIPVHEIICITASAPYISIRTHDKEYLHTDTLKNLQATLSAEYFVRVHKSTIINIHYVVSSTSRLNGDYDILLRNNREIRLSRNYAKLFKEKFEKRFEKMSSPHQ